MGVCLQAINQMVGLERFEMAVKLVEEVLVICWHWLFHCLICITSIGDGGFPGF